MRDNIEVVAFMRFKRRVLVQANNGGHIDKLLVRKDSTRPLVPARLD